MDAAGWAPVPVGLDAQRWVTRAGCRTVIAVVHTLVAARRVLDLVALVECDARVQVVYTVGPSAFNRGVDQYLTALGALVLPWEQAVRERFDAAVAAASGGLHQIHAPLMLSAHGAGRGKPVRPASHGGPTLASPPVFGLDAQRLVHDGRLLPTVLLIAHESERAVLARQCPEALEVALLAGDVCFDRLVASRTARDKYRRAIGLSEGERLLVVSSTWGRNGLFGNTPDLLPRLLEELDGVYRVAVLLHPAVWTGHGLRQIRAWLRDCCQAGMLLADPHRDWRSLVVAADAVLGDHGSVTAYAAAFGAPMVCLPPALHAVSTGGSPQELVARHAPHLDPTRPLLPQVHAARPVDPQRVAALVTGCPGQAAHVARHALYELLNLTPPGRHRRADLVPAPQFLSPEDSS